MRRYNDKQESDPRAGERRPTFDENNFLTKYLTIAFDEIFRWRKFPAIQSPGDCRLWKWRKGRCCHGYVIKLVFQVDAVFTNDQRFEWMSVYTEILTYTRTYECRHAHVHKHRTSLTFSSSRMRFSVSSLISFWACCSSLWCFSPRDCSWEPTLAWSAVIRRDSSSIWVCWSANSFDVFFELAWRPICNSVTLGDKQTKPARSKTVSSAVYWTIEHKNRLSLTFLLLTSSEPVGETLDVAGFDNFKTSLEINIKTACSWQARKLEIA